MKFSNKLFLLHLYPLLLYACTSNDNAVNELKDSPNLTNEKTRVSDIALPDGFSRVKNIDSFGLCLRNFQLKKNNTVYLYNGQPAKYQSNHIAVLDLSTGNKDLQQCADCIMRLIAEYYFYKNEFDKIAFKGSDGKIFSFKEYADAHKKNYSHELLLKFMELVFSYCGTYTVAAISKPINIQDIMPGDILVHAGSPGHAMIVMDVAENKKGERIFLLAQGFMPAQDMHIVINPIAETFTPWYFAQNNANITTPGWTFNSAEIKRLNM